MTTALEGETVQPKRRPIGLFVFLLTIASAAAAGLFAAFSGDEIVDPVRVAERGEDYAVAVEAIFAFAIPVVAAFVGLAVLIVLVRGRRAPIWKLAVSFLIFCLVATLIAIPIRAFTFGEYLAADREAVQRQYEEARDEVNALRRTVFDADGFLQMPGGGPPNLGPNSTLDQRVAALEGQRGVFSNYRGEVEEIIARRRAELEAMDVFYQVKFDALEKYDRVFRPHVARHLELMEQELAKQVEAGMFLRSHRASWILQDDGIVAFTDRNVMRQYAELMRELDEISSELDRLDGALGNVEPQQPATLPTDEQPT